MAKTIQEIARQALEIRGEHYARDQRMSHVRSVRSGEVTNVIPGLMPNEWPKPIIANTIDVAARFTSEQIGILPTVMCTSGIMVSDRQKKYAQKRTNIVHNYMQTSKLKVKLVQAADWFETYGFLPILVEPFFGDSYCPAGPRIRFDNPMGSYYRLDAFGVTQEYYKVYEEDVAKLVAKFPHLRAALVTDPSEMTTRRRTTMVQYMDADQIVWFLPDKNNLVLNQMPNKFGQCPVYIAERAMYDGETRGSFDDVSWIQLARARFAMLGLNAAEMSVNAPIAVDMSVTRMNFGPDAIIRSQDPSKIRRVGMEMSPAAMQIGEMLNGEVMTGARFPENATGKSPGSIVTGAGVDALNGTIDTKIKTSQLQIGDALQRALSACLEMDEKFWPRLQRQVRVQVDGNTFEETYKPIKDIAGIHEVEVTYGMAAGMDPNRALVFLLQARGDKLISRYFALRQLPFDVNADQVMEQIDNEEMADALKQGMFSMLGSIGLMAQQGQDPIDVLQKAAMVMKERERGTALQDAFLKAFTPPKQPPGGLQAPGADQSQVPGGQPPGPGGAPPPGAPNPQQGVAPGQAGQGPGGAPDIQKLMAAMTGGGGGGPQTPNLQDVVQRRLPAG